MKVWVNLKRSSSCDGCNGWDVGEWEPIYGIYATEELAVERRPEDRSGKGWDIEYRTVELEVIEN